MPKPLPKKLATSEVTKTKRIKPIDTFTFLDDSTIVKVYIELKGDLAGVDMSCVEAEFADRSLMVSIETAELIHRFHVDRLMYEVDASRCKAAMTKSGKLLLKLHKVKHLELWTKLRSSV